MAVFIGSIALHVPDTGLAAGLWSEDLDHVAREDPDFLAPEGWSPPLAFRP